MLKGKVAVITGSTSGIGLGIAECLAKAGAHVVLNGLGDDATIAAAQKSVKAQNKRIKVRYHSADMTKPDQIADLIDYARRDLGSVDIVVNNAGIQHTSPVESFPIDQWDAIIAINLTSAFHTTRAALPLMRVNRWGRIINIASVHGLVASEHKAAYVAAKHGIIGLTKVVALEAAGQGVTCNAICPGWVRTPLVERQIEALAKSHGLTIEKAAEKLLEEKQPSKAFVEVADLAALVLFLCSDAAAQMTGVSLPVDGAWTAR